MYILAIAGLRSTTTLPEAKTVRDIYLKLLNYSMYIHTHNKESVKAN